MAERVGGGGVCDSSAAGGVGGVGGRAQGCAQRAVFHADALGVHTICDKWQVASDTNTPQANHVTRHLSPDTLFIGTHALLAGGFGLPRLGLVIIDEQHKFGVAQRETLVRKGNYPHLLVMTATPIPRTLGLTLYGDLEVSVIDELPGGRGQIKTFIRTADPAGAGPQVWEFIREKLAAGRQAYVVYPRVEESDGKGLKIGRAHV